MIHFLRTAIAACLFLGLSPVALQAHKDIVFKNNTRLFLSFILPSGSCDYIKPGAEITIPNARGIVSVPIYMYKKKQDRNYYLFSLVGTGNYVLHYHQNLSNTKLIKAPLYELVKQQSISESTAAFLAFIKSQNGIHKIFRYTRFTRGVLDTFSNFRDGCIKEDDVECTIENCS